MPMRYESRKADGPATWTQGPLFSLHLSSTPIDWFVSKSATPTNHKFFLHFSLWKNRSPSLFWPQPNKRGRTFFGKTHRPTSVLSWASLEAKLWHGQPGGFCQRHPKPWSAAAFAGFYTKKTSQEADFYTTLLNLYQHFWKMIQGQTSWLLEWNNTSC